MPQVAEPVNIFSGADEPLGAALTNPTELARSKNKLSKAYPVFFNGRRFPDAEAAYQFSKQHSDSPHEMMVEVLVAKFRQHEDLAAEVAARGGAAWLKTCSHLTNARSEGAQAWEGVGLESRYIRLLVQGYERFISGDNTEMGQAPLF